MFFILSKVLSFFLIPVNALFTLTLCWWVTSHFKMPRFTQFLGWLTVSLWLLVGYVPLPDYLLSQLENTHPQPHVDYTDLTGLIVLGGAEGYGYIAKARNEATLKRAAERLTTTVEIAKNNPHLKVLYTGHSGTLIHRGWSGAEIAQKFLLDQGVFEENILLENRSRNTFENAERSKVILEKPENDGRWGLITSAAHMKRSMLIFEKVGLGSRMTPIPVDYETSGRANWWNFNIRDGAEMWRNYIHETVGTFIYRLTGRL